MQIKKHHLEFMQEAKAAFEANDNIETYRNEKAEMIALRYGADRDCIRIYELGLEVAFFAQMIDRPSKLSIKDVRDEVRWFAVLMEAQLFLNENKGGWHGSHPDWLNNELFRNYSKMVSATNETEIIRRCTNVANFAMMIADNARVKAGFPL